MFSVLFILGIIFPNIPFFENLYPFTSWQVGQNHLLICGFLIPALYLFVTKNLNIRTPAILILAWSVTTLIFVLGQWLIATVEAALWNKKDAFGFLDYPGWGYIEKILHPYQAVLLYLILTSLFFFGVWYYTSPDKWTPKE